MDASLITYTQFVPLKALENYICAYWFFSSEELVQQQFDILPDGYFDLVITCNNGCITNCRLVGIWNSRIAVHSSACRQIGIRFKPYALLGLLNLRIADLLNTGTSFNLSDWGINSDIVLTSPPEILVGYWNDLFLKKVDDKSEDKRLLSVFNLIENTNGIISVKDLSPLSGMCDRQMRRRMNELIGIGVKEYANIVRFKKTMKLLKTDKTRYDAYFDQSHFIKNFKAYTGIIPSDFEFGNNVRFLQYFDFEKD